MLNQFNPKILLIVILFSLSACAVSEKRAEASKTNSNALPEVAKKGNEPILPSPEPKNESNSNKMSAQEIKDASVKADDYDENSGLKKDELCGVEAYVVDKDPNGLNIRSRAKDGEIIGKIPFNEEGTIVHITGADYAGWVRIDHAETVDGTVVFNKKGWVSANLLATSTTGYGTKGVNLYEFGVGSKILTIVPPETEVRILACNQKAIRVKYKNFDGWLDADSQCANPVTNCS